MSETRAVPQKSLDLFTDFADYCRAYPDLRFWQALRSWSGQRFILASELPAESPIERDTFYWETKDGKR